MPQYRRDPENAKAAGGRLAGLRETRDDADPLGRKQNQNGERSQHVKARDGQSADPGGAAHRAARLADLTAQEKETYRKDLLDIRYHRHDRLIALGREAVTWVYPYSIPTLDRARAVECVPPGTETYDG